RRVDVPMLPEWADFLWTRAETSGELRKLRSWGVDAYRASPNAQRLREDITLGIRMGSLPVPNGVGPLPEDCELASIKPPGLVYSEEASEGGRRVA
ncbi:MAG: hypothetical protein M3R38_32170, partial [Actinomycetota bacterium]|nr:hypothetical protein [Actinomycetota bacterium]